MVIIFLSINIVLLGYLIVKHHTIRMSSDNIRDALHRIAQQDREEQARNARQLSDSIGQRMTEIATLQKHQLDTFSKQLETLTTSSNTRLEHVRATVEQKLHALQQDNSQKLEKMRETVDEKLHSTLEKRLGESFQVVSDRLEMVHKGLGEMQTLANGVGDLKKVLTNVKTRGVWGEIQLGSLLEQVLTKEQYEQNVKIKPNTTEFVEFAIKLPGKGDADHPMWLPIDSKFPQDAYQRLLDAQEAANLEEIETAGKMLDQQLKVEAKKINEKYIYPPHTTDFAIMFLPTEGLYADALRRPGMYELLQTKYRILVAGPSTLAALLNSLQMGFRTLQIEKRSSEVWTLLGVVKGEFSKFGDILDKTHKKLQEAGNTIELASRKSRNIERKLKRVEGVDVESLDSGESHLEEAFSMQTSVFMLDSEVGDSN